MVNLNEKIELLGMKAKDKVTGFEGVITSICFDLYGCIQALVHPGNDKDGNLRDQKWFDIGRLKITGKLPVMKRPDFQSILSPQRGKGPAEKPSFTKM